MKETAFEYYIKMMRPKDNKIHPIVKKTVEIALKEQKEEIFVKVENHIIRPYEGCLKTSSKCCMELHRSILDNLREWFDKLKKEYD